MTRKKPLEWTKLDNAAKIFPPTTNEKDTKVFRYVCELKEKVDEGILQDALNKTITLFPIYRSILRRGVFWYYFESTEDMPKVNEEHKLPCSMLYRQNRKNLLFEVTYYKNRINLEIYHALADGAGARGFLVTLIYYYITIKYKDDFNDQLPRLDYDASFSQKMDDSFLKHYAGNKKQNKIRLTKACHITGRRSIDNRFKIIEGIMNVKEVLNLAHRYDTTMTIYLAALFIKSIYMEMSVRNRRYPVVLSVPVNLRTYFPSVTARNFFGTINISYNFTRSGDDIESIIRGVKEAFSRELTEEKLRNHMDRLSSLEHNAFTRVVPLFLKDWVLRFANHLNDRTITATLSNVGMISLDKEIMPYIRLFNCFNSARRPQISICSFEEQLVVNFVSPFDSTEIQKNFYRMLTKEDIEITITSNSSDIM